MTMLLLSEIARLSDTVDGDWRSPVADAVAAAWGFPPGAARYWRSSASHVFAVRGEGRERPGGFLRCVPAHLIGRSQVDPVAALMARLADAGAATVPIVPSSAGNLVETVDVGGWQLNATVVADVGGPSVDVDELTPAQAVEWGAALGRLHRDGDAAATGLALPDGRDRIDRALDVLAGHPVLGEVADAVRPRLAAGPRDAGTYGLVHGDFELDNLGWVDGVPVAFDFDEAERSWFVADVAYAIRDLVPDPRALAEAPTALVAAFLAGYGRERPTAAVGPDELVLFTLVNALRSIARLVPVLEEDPAAGATLTAMGSGRTLRDVLVEYAAEQERVALDLVPLLR